MEDKFETPITEFEHTQDGHNITEAAELPLTKKRKNRKTKRKGGSLAKKAHIASSVYIDNQAKKAVDHLNYLNQTPKLPLIKSMSPATPTKGLKSYR